jgi:hypothetical protein
MTPERTTPARQAAREHRFLTDAARGHAPFVAQARARLEAGEEHYGDSWAWIGIRRHLTELLEEAADLGAWATLADQALDADPKHSELNHDQIRAVLNLVARRGAQAHEALTAALRSIDSLEKR